MAARKVLSRVKRVSLGACFSRSRREYDVDSFSGGRVWWLVAVELLCGRNSRWRLGLGLGERER